MKFLRPLLVLLLLAVLLVGVWLWWSFPRRVDMADYAPANSIVYVEFNNQRWYSSVPLAPLDPATFRQVGEWHGFPVYTWARTGPSIIYIPVAQGSDAYAAYSRKQ